jgi:uncharacterized membrane protein
MRLLARARERFWLIPLCGAALAVGLGLGSVALDQQLSDSVRLPFLFSSGADGARALLGAIVSSMISFTALVFSITIVTLQLTSGQFSPRVLRTFLQDRFNQVTLAVFIATFVYAMVVLRSVRSEFVPQIGVTVAFLLVLASVVVFLFYLHHIAQSIRVASIIASIGDETRDLIERRYPVGDDSAEPARAEPAPAELPRTELPRADPPSADPSSADRPRADPPSAETDPGAGPTHVVAAARPGIVAAVDDASLFRLVKGNGCRVELLRAVGEFVPTGAALLRVHGSDPPADLELCAAITLGEERTLEQDVGFGLRQLVDIAERALSPGINDPTTAIQVLDQLHDLLRRLATRPLRLRVHTTGDGRIAVWVPGPGFEDYLKLGVDEIDRWGADARRVRNRLRGMLRDLHTAALPEHRAPIARQLERWDERPGPLDQPDLTPSDVGLRPSRAWDERP